MDKEYTLNGTIDGIVEIFEKDFQLQHDEAKFSAYILTSINLGNFNSKQEDLNLWYFNNNEGYQTPILNTHYTISISDFKIALLKKLFVVACVFLATKEAGAVALGAELLVSLSECIKRISDNEYCVFSIAVRISKNNREKLLSKSNLLPNRDQPECTYRSDKWTCPHLRGDICSLDSSDLDKILSKLCDVNAMEQIGDFWKIEK